MGRIVRRRRGMARVLPLLIGLLLLDPSGAGGKEPGVASIRSISFLGNETIDNGKLRGAMRLRQPVWYSPFRRTPYLGPDYLTLDLYRILDRYRDEGFPLAMVKDAAVRLLEDDEAVEIVIEIEEGPRCRVASVELIGVQPLLQGKARSRTRVTAGGYLRRCDLQKTRDAIEALLAEGGYLGAQVRTDVTLAGTAAAVQVRVREGPLFRMRSVVIDSTAGSLEKTKPVVVTREVNLKPGATVRTSKILKIQDRLYETGVFRTVRVVPVPDSLGEPVADLRVIVNERKSGWYGFGAGYSSDDRVRLLAEWGNRNVGGKARRIEVDGDISFSFKESPAGSRSPIRTSLLRVRYTMPWFLNTRTRSVTTLYHTYDREARSDDQATVFDRNITGLEEALSRSIGRYSRIGIGLTNKWVRSGDPEAVDETYQTRNISELLEEDRRDNILDPMRGTHTRLLSEYAGGLLGGQNEFSRWTASTSWYRPLRKKWILAMRARAGLIVPVGRGVSETGDSLLVSRIPFEERFRLGGGTTVRGYRDNSLGRIDENDLFIGGTALLLANLELRFPIYWMLRGALFFDAGNVWADPEEIKVTRFHDGFHRDHRSPLDVAYSVGGGLRFMTPVGPLRIDYGRKLGGGQRSGESRGEFHLSLGQAF